MTTLRKD